MRTQVLIKLTGLKYERAQWLFLTIVGVTLIPYLLAGFLSYIMHIVFLIDGVQSQAYTDYAIAMASISWSRQALEGKVLMSIPSICFLIYMLSESAICGQLKSKHGHKIKTASIHVLKRINNKWANEGQITHRGKLILAMAILSIFGGGILCLRLTPAHFGEPEHSRTWNRQVTITEDNTTIHNGPASIERLSANSFLVKFKTNAQPGN